MNENTLNLYDEESPISSGNLGNFSSNLTDSAEKKFGRFSGTEGRQRRAIVLRNILLEVVLSLLVQEAGLNSRCVA